MKELIPFVALISEACHEERLQRILGAEQTPTAEGSIATAVYCSQMPFDLLIIPEACPYNPL